MKKVFRVLVPILIVIAILLGAYWFFLRYRTDLTAGMLVDAGDSRMKNGGYESAVRCYRWAHELQPKDVDLALKLAEAYRSAGNYTKTEQTLVQAKTLVPSDLRLCKALSQVYVEQDKLLDAKQMLDTVSSAALRQTLSELRPAAPVLSREDRTCTIRLSPEDQAASAVCYYTTDGSFPSLESSVYTEPFLLPQGETVVCAVVVSADGLISQESKDTYLIDGIIEDAVFRDPALEAAVRKKLDRPTGTIQTNELWGIDTLELPTNMTSMEDLSYFKGLIRLIITGENDLDYHFLRGLSALRYLEIDSCVLEAEDMEAIAACPMLEVLILTNCDLGDHTAPLAALSGLRILNLDHSNVSNIQSLVSLSTLEELYLRDNALTALPSMQSFTGLRRLDLAHNSLESISELAACPSLEELDLSYNRLNSIRALASLPKLRILNASFNSIADVSALASCVQLEELWMTNNVLEQIDVFSQNLVIREICVDHNLIRSAPVFPEGCALEEFSANWNELTSLDSLAGLPQLNYVYADYNEELANVDALESCPLLATVSVYETAIHSAGRLGEIGVYVRYTDADASQASTEEQNP